MLSNSRIIWLSNNHSATKGSYGMRRDKEQEMLHPDAVEDEESNHLALVHACQTDHSMKSDISTSSQAHEFCKKHAPNCL